MTMSAFRESKFFVSSLSTKNLHIKSEKNLNAFCIYDVSQPFLHVWLCTTWTSRNLFTILRHFFSEYLIIVALHQFRKFVCSPKYIFFVFWGSIANKEMRSFFPFHNPLFSSELRLTASRKTTESRPKIGILLQDTFLLATKLETEARQRRFSPIVGVPWALSWRRRKGGGKWNFCEGKKPLWLCKLQYKWTLSTRKSKTKKGSL